MANDPDAGLVKRGLVLLLVMLLIVGTVVFILFQGRQSEGPPTSASAEHLAMSVVVPVAAYPANISWAALEQLSEHMPSPVGWEIRHNTWATLARRGSDQVPWRQFPEMLDLNRATANARQQLKDTQEPPEGAARTLVIAALKAVAEWHTKRREANKTDLPNGLVGVYEAVDRLADSPIPEIREQAKKTQETFFRG
jgi:hypothetical protein